MIIWCLILAFHGNLNNIAIYETRNRGTGTGMGGMQRNVFNILRNFSEDLGECYQLSILWNDTKNYGERSRRFRRMF